MSEKHLLSLLEADVKQKEQMLCRISEILQLKQWLTNGSNRSWGLPVLGLGQGHGIKIRTGSIYIEL